MKMDSAVAKLELCSFYPENFFEIKDCCINESGIVVKLKSKKQNCECPKCHQISNVYHVARMEESSQVLSLV